MDKITVCLKELDLKKGVKVKLKSRLSPTEIRSMMNGPGWARNLMQQHLGKTARIDDIDCDKNQVHLDCGFWWTIDCLDIKSKK